MSTINAETALGNAVKDLEAGKTLAPSRSRSRETSGLHPKRPNSHESGYENPLRRYPTPPRFQVQEPKESQPNFVARPTSWSDLSWWPATTNELNSIESGIEELGIVGDDLD